VTSPVNQVGLGATTALTGAGRAAGHRWKDRRVRILVLGGSWFVGAAAVEQAAAAGHEVTVFNRGRTPATYPDGVTVTHGDRTNLADLTALAGSGPWDAVVDVAGSVPTMVRDSARALASVAHRYVFVSTVSVYRDWPDRPVIETSSLHVGDPDAGSAQEGTPGPVAYGILKAGCEAAIAREFPADRTLVVRPGVVLGPGEYVGRIPWWLSRMRRGGRVLAPGRPDRSIQPVDVRDLVGFVLAVIQQSGSGIFNAAPAQDRETYGGFLAACAQAVGVTPDVTWVDEHWLAGQGVRQWTELPLWRIAPGTWAMDTVAAQAAGLSCRPLLETVRDVQAWLQSGGAPVPHARWKEHGIDPDKEAAVLAAWDRWHVTSPP
jgi:nucleoside-diphosphate-sugar epimerase